MYGTLDLELKNSANTSVSWEIIGNNLTIMKEIDGNVLN